LWARLVGMLGGVFLGLLEALLLGFTRFLLARGLQIVGGGIVLAAPAEDAEDTRQQPTHGATPRTSSAKGARQGIEGGSIHGVSALDQVDD
jgi:hypothetical protein